MGVSFEYKDFYNPLQAMYLHLHPGKVNMEAKPGKVNMEAKNGKNCADVFPLRVIFASSH